MLEHFHGVGDSGVLQQVDDGRVELQVGNDNNANKELFDILKIQNKNTKKDTR